jgi:hypothetical protein
MFGVFKLGSFNRATGHDELAILCDEHPADVTLLTKHM